MIPQKRAKDEEPGAQGAEEGPPKKAGRIDDPKAEKTEAAEVKEEKKEEKVEAEKDAPADRRKAFGGSVAFDPSASTLNVVPTVGGRVLMALSDAGMHNLVASARANVGVKAGRYLYEARIMEVLNPAEPGRRTAAALPKQQVRVGFSTSSSSLFLTDNLESVCFDSEGFFHAAGKKSSTGSRYGRDQVMGVLLNLDPKSPNANTVSLFRDGQRMCEPQPLPEACVGKPLFPHVSFRNVSLQVHFGPEPMAPLPFKCRTLQGAAQADVLVNQPAAPKGGKYDVLFPVALPDEGTFDWLDAFLAKNPGYVELSDRSIVEWAQKSGLAKPKSNQWKNSNDKPDVSFGVPSLDDLSARRIIATVAPLVPRNYVVMEVKANLLKAERQELLKRFGSACFRKVAHVVMGEPPSDYKGKVRAEILKEKQEKLDTEWKAKQAEKERKRLIEMRQKEIMAKREAEARKKAEEAAKMEVDAEGEVKAEEGDATQVEPKEEPKEEKDEVKEEAEEEAEPPKAVLTEEEEKLWFKQQAVSDVTSGVLSGSFASFSVPSKEEGFAEIRFEWQKDGPCREYLRKWILEKKLTTRVEDVAPTEWFFSRHQEWQKTLQDWQMRQKEFKSDPARQEAARLREQKLKEKAEAEAAKEDGGKPGDEAGKAEGEEGEAASAPAEQAEAAPPAEAAQDSQEGEKGEAAAGGAEGAEERGAAEAGDDVEVTPIDISAVEDVCDIGGGEPLFSGFMFEDWSLMGLRFELHLLVQAFKRDVNDPERPGMHESHLAFYYQKYFRKQLNTKFFGKDKISELIDLVKDTVNINGANSIIQASLSEEKGAEAATFVKLTEESRRERQRKIDAGDETARLRFSVLASGPQGGQGPQQPRVVPSNAAANPRPYHGGWNQKGGSWRAPYGQAGYGKGHMGQQRWPGMHGYAPKAAGWR